MDDDQQNEQNALLAWILGIAVTIAVAVSLIVGIMAAMNSGTTPSTRAAPSVGAAPAAATAAATAAPTAAATTAAPAATPAAGSAAGTAAATAGSAAVTEVDVAPALAVGAGYPGLVKFHFDTAKYDLPPDSAAQLAAIVDWARADPAARVGVSGFHDKHGDDAANALLARRRAVATRDALLAAGVPIERIVLVKPQETTGGSDDREARRVDVYPAR